MPSGTQSRPAASVPSTWTRASLAVSRTRQATAGPSGCAGIPSSASRPSTVLPCTALPTSAASNSLAASVPCTWNSSRPALAVRQGIQTVDEVLGQGQFIAVRPLLREPGDRLPVQARRQPPHDQLRDRGRSLIGRQPLEGLLDPGSSLTRLTSPRICSRSPCSGRLRAGLGVRGGETDEPGRQAPGLLGLELGGGQIGRRHRPHPAAHATAHAAAHAATHAAHAAHHAAAAHAHHQAAAIPAIESPRRST